MPSAPEGLAANQPLAALTLMPPMGTLSAGSKIDDAIELFSAELCGRDGRGGQRRQWLFLLRARRDLHSIGRGTTDLFAKSN